MDDDASSVFTAESESASLAEDVEARNEAKRLRRQQLASNITTIVVINLDGSRFEKKLAVKVQSYSELQRELSRVLPGSQQMYVIQDEKGRRIGSEGFVPRSKVFVRSLLIKPPPESELRKLPFNWEGTDFHEVRLKREADQRIEEEVNQGISFLN